MRADNDLAIILASILLLGFRVAPVFVFAPPFTLARVPKLVLWLFGFCIAMMLVLANPDTARVADLKLSTLTLGAGREFLIGLSPVLALQLFFGSLYFAGRTIDIQSGFGLALLIDPASRGQIPMVGVIFAYLAGVVFFTINGHHEILRFFSASLELLPIGAPITGNSLPALLAYVSSIFLLAFGVAAAAILSLFLTDVIVAMLSRTVPQLNALLLGIQVKALLLLLVLPIVVSMSGALLVRMATTALRVTAELL